MSAIGYAEKLIILDNHINGLLCRLHDLINFNKILTAQQQQGVANQAGLLELLNNDLPKFIQALSKKFPDTPENMEKIQGYDQFHKRATEIHTGLQPFYHTYIDVIETKELVFATLLDCVKNFTVLKFDLNRFIMAKFFDLFVKYVQLIILSSRVEERRGLLLLYAQAHHKTGNTEPHLPKIADFIKLYDNPLKQLRDECGELSDRLGEICMTFVMPILAWSDYNNFPMKAVFNVLEDSKTMEVASKDKEFQELMYLESFQEWIMYTYLICPQALQTEGSVNMLLAVLKEHMMITVFRDQLLDIHTEMATLFDSFQVKTPKKAFKLSAHKKQLKEVQAAAQDTVEHYQKLRTYLVCEMDTLLNFLEEYPGCIAPKINMILAVTTLARANVTWYMKHQDVQPHRKSKNYQFALDHENIAQLIRLNYAFKDLVVKYTSSIEQYYKAQLLVDLAKLNEVLPAFKSNISGVLAQLIDLIVDDARQGKTCDDTRLNWYRVSAAMFHVQSNISHAQAQTVCSRLNDLIDHSRHIDLLKTEINSAGNFMSLLWVPDKLTELAQKAPANCMVAITRTLSDAVQNLHKNAGEEAHFVVQKSQQTAISLLYGVAQRILMEINTIKTEIKQLRAQTGYERVLQMMVNPGLADRMPGYESGFKGLPNLRQAKQSLAGLCESVIQNPTIHVCLIEFFPKEYVREKLIGGLRKEIVESVAKFDENGNMKKPSGMLTHFKDVMYAFHTVEQYMNIDMSKLFREGLFNGFCDPKCGGPADPLVVDQSPILGEIKVDGGPLIEGIAMWYSQLFTKPWLLAGCNPYSQTLRAFVNMPGYKQDYQGYTDVIELRALCTLIGPYGCRVLDSRLLEIVAANVAKIKEVIQKNQTTLTALVNKSMYAQSWTSAVQSISPGDIQELSQSASRAGSVLKFRRDLRSALEWVVSQGVPFIYAPVKAAHDIIHDFERANPDQLAMDMLASDCGIAAGEADHALKHALSKFKTSNVDVAHWTLLPEIFALAFKSQFWKMARYSVALDGHMNNAHCMDECLVALIVNFARINTAAGQKPDDKIQEDLERFVRCASYSILHMYRANIHDEPVHHAMMMIEMFINRTGGRVKLAFLEECFPYTMLRTNYIQLYQRQTQADGTAYAAADASTAEEAKTEGGNSEAPPAT